MAVPEGVTPVYNNIIVSVYTLGSGFGIRGNSPTARVGTVYKIGQNVYRISVNQKIGFLTTEAQFVTDLGETFSVIPQDEVLITYVDIPPP